MLIDELREKRQAAIDRAKAIQKKATDESRDLNEQEVSDFDAAMDEADELQGKIDDELAKEQRAARLESAERSQDNVVRRSRPEQPGAGDMPRITATRRREHSRHFQNDDDAEITGHVLRSVIYGAEDSRNWLADNGLDARALSTNINTAGGFTVPDALASTIVDLREEYGFARQNARVVTMGSDTWTEAVATGGATAYYVGENTTITASEPTFSAYTLTAKKLATRVLLSSELNEDSVIGIADYVAERSAYALAVAEDDAFFKGDGTSTYGGFYGITTKIDDGNHTASISTAATGNTSFGTLDLVDFENVVGKLPQFPGQRPKWYISKPGWAASMHRIAMAAGGNTAANISGGTGMSFLGYDVVWVPSMNKTTTPQTDTIVALFGDLTQSSTIGARRNISLATDASGDRFDADQIAVRATQRYAFAHHSLGDTSNAGAVVALKTPSA